jgi:hypothetical protein
MVSAMRVVVRLCHPGVMMPHCHAQIRRCRRQSLQRDGDSERKCNQQPGQSMKHR